MAALLTAIQAGRDYFQDYPEHNYARAERAARSQFIAVIEREWFMAGWNSAFWDEQERVLKASREG